MYDVEWCPGNMSRYRIQAMKVEDVWTLIWFSDADVGGHAYRGQIPNTRSYFMEKTGVRHDGDADALLCFYWALNNAEVHRLPGTLKGKIGLHPNMAAADQHNTGCTFQDRERWDEGDYSCNSKEADSANEAAD